MLCRDFFYCSAYPVHIPVCILITMYMFCLLDAFRVVKSYHLCVVVLGILLMPFMRGCSCQALPILCLSMNWVGSVDFSGCPGWPCLCGSSWNFANDIHEMLKLSDPPHAFCTCLWIELMVANVFVYNIVCTDFPGYCSSKQLIAQWVSGWAILSTVYLYNLQLL